jgi:serine/threonine protein phosphatase PrpC
VVVIFQGRRAVVANVGDSSAVLCGGHPEAHAMRHIDSWPGSARAVAKTAKPEEIVAAPSPHPELARGPTDMEMSADHSPECEAEFTRMREARPSVSDSRRPELLFVYDTLTASKMSCPHIFVVDPASGKPIRTNRGTYYKNVRNEWATLVATPSYAQFQDALAFTRSLGDLHLQSYGVSHVPEVRWIDFAPQDASGHATPPSHSPLVLTACSDGVWDNWKFHDMATFVLHPERTADPDAQRSTVALMTTNLERARVNFGSSADNMTAVCVYMRPAKHASHSGSAGASSSRGADAHAVSSSSSSSSGAAAAASASSHA